MPRGQTHTAALILLPAFDEYMVGYADREAALGDARRIRPITPAEALSPLILRDGRAVGTWKRFPDKDGVSVAPGFFAAPTRKDLDAFERAAHLYGRFLGLPVTVSEYLSGNMKREHGGRT